MLDSWEREGRPPALDDSLKRPCREVPPLTTRKPVSLLVAVGLAVVVWFVFCTVVWVLVGKAWGQTEEQVERAIRVMNPDWFARWNADANALRPSCFILCPDDGPADTVAVQDKAFGEWRRFPDRGLDSLRAEVDSLRARMVRALTAVDSTNRLLLERIKVLDARVRDAVPPRWDPDTVPGGRKM